MEERCGRLCVLGADRQWALLSYLGQFTIFPVKAWQMFVIGVAVLLAALLLPSYEAVLAGVTAVAMLAVIIAGFVLRPRKEVFCLRTTQVLPEPDQLISVEHDLIAVRVELARLWLLFPLTMAAIAFLIITSTRGTTWKFRFLDRFWEMSSYPILIVRMFLVLVIAILSTWVSERWVLRDAEACSADSVSMMAGRLLYSFRDGAGEYYGGEGFPFDLVRSMQLRRIVFYRGSNPQLNKIAMACLFHRVVIVGRGLTDLDSATVAARLVRPAPQHL
jgi:hypothetical protein